MKYKNFRANWRECYPQQPNDFIVLLVKVFAKR